MRDAAEVFNKGIEANPADPLNYVGLARLPFTTLKRQRPKS